MTTPVDLDALAAEYAEALAGDDATDAVSADGRTSVQTLLVPAAEFGDGMVHDTGRTAEQLVLEYAEEFLTLVGGDDELMGRVLTKLADRPVDDVRIEVAPGDDEQVVRAAATALDATLAAAEAHPTYGLRIEGLAGPDRRRAIRSLGVFLETLGRVPEGFVVSVPGAATVAHVDALARVAQRIEKEIGGRLLLELELDRSEAVLGPEGAVAVAGLLHHADGRVVDLAFVPTGHVEPELALALARTAAAGAGLRVVDGTVPLADHDAAGAAGWEQHVGLVRQAWSRGLLGGRDRHAWQLPSRYAATYLWFRDHEAALPPELRRLGQACGALDGTP